MLIFLPTIFHPLHEEWRLFHWLRKMNWEVSCKKKKRKTIFQEQNDGCCSHLLNQFAQESTNDATTVFFLLFLNVAAEASRCFIMMYYMLTRVYAHLGIYLQPSFKWAVLQRWPEMSSIVPLSPLKDTYLLLSLPAIMSLHLCTFSPE